MDKKKHWTERPITKWIANLITLVVVGFMAFFVWKRVFAQPRVEQDTIASVTQLPSEVNPTKENVEKVIPETQTNDLTLATINIDSQSDGFDINRIIEFHTSIPSRPRVDVITYTVQKGDTLFGIADGYGIKPETLLWGNFEVLKDNPHLLSPDQVLNVLPVNGVYYQWKDGDTFDSIAVEFKTTTELIEEYPGNRFDAIDINNGTQQVKSGTWVIIPEGKRPIKDWGPPAISRSNPAAARYYGEGSCGSVYEGAIGTGYFIWPTAYHGISGYGYSAIHPAIDIGGSEGNAIVAMDSGVVVFAGWSNFGYGNMIVIDHGNGFQTAYAHLSAVAVTCGQSVFQSSYIGAMGTTGNSTGPHLHLEVSYNGAKPNPLEFLP
jgi:murein DD-endopeptidase MepM/ murein hydrolase activator NlpD